MTPKPDKPTFPPLFSKGFCEVMEADIQDAFVGDINTPKRKMLASQLRLFISELKRLGVKGELWINGSFSTKNPNPTDIDLALCASKIVLGTMSNEHLATLQHYASINGRVYVREKWGCDFYIIDSSNISERTYFQDLFSSNPDLKNTKGIPVVKI